MKQKKSENNDAMSAGELLGRLKKNFADDGSAQRGKGKVSHSDQNVVPDDDIDIAELLKRYLPENGNEKQAQSEAVADELDEFFPDEKQKDEERVDIGQAEKNVPACSAPEQISIDELAGGDWLASDEEVLAQENAAAEGKSTGDMTGEKAQSECMPNEPAAKKNASEELVQDITSESWDGSESIPAEPQNPGIRKYIYHFRLSDRSAVTKTVKVQETVEPIPADSRTVRGDSYFTDHGKVEFALDDDPVIPDSSAFMEEPPVTSEVQTNKLDDTAAETHESASGDEEKTEKKALDDTDINLMIALGYEDELEKTVGVDKVSEIEKQLDTDSGNENTRESAAFRGFEYTEKAQAKEIMQSYKAEYSSMLVRMLGTLLLLVALFLYENISLFGVSLPGALNMMQYPTVHTLISLQLLVLCGALSWRQLFDGLRGAVTFKPTPQSLTAVAVAVAAVYDLIVALAAPEGGVSLYNFPAALCLALLVLYDYMNLKREMYSFTILADRRDKFAVRAETESGDEAALRLDIRRASFIKHYFARTNKRNTANHRLNFVLLPVVVLAIALAIISYSISDTKQAMDALNIFVLTVLFCMPVSTLVACSYPLFRAAQIAFEQDTAIIGESSVEEYSGAESVSFADKDVFPSYSVKLRSIKLYGNARPDLVLFAATSVFSRVGGPLADVLELATVEFDRAQSVDLVHIAENGIEAVVDGTNVLLGRAEFLESYNIYPLHDAEDDANLSGGARILYIVMNGTLCAKLYVQYDIDVDFEFALRELAHEGVSAKIRTYDPNIDDELLTAKLRGKRYPVRIDKQFAEPKESDPLPQLDSGLVSRASAKSLLHTVMMCSRLMHVEHTGMIIRGVSLAVSLLIMIFLMLLSSSVGISSVYVALYQLFWMIPALIITRLFVK